MGEKRRKQSKKRESKVRSLFMRFVHFNAILVSYKEAPNWTSSIFYHILLFQIKLLTTIFCKVKCLMTHFNALSLELLLQWKDSRIIISEEENLEESKILILHKDLLDLLWIPEIYIYDLHNIKKHSLIQASENLILIKNNSSFK